MPKHVQLSSVLGDWSADIAGAQVSLTPTGVANVTADGDRLVADDGARSLSGAAAVAGDIVWVTIAGDVFAFTVTHGAHRARETRDHDAFMPPMSATVVRIAAKVGDRVQAGDVLIALEAMKMELPIKSPRDGVVRAINCREGELVQPDQILIELE